MQSENVSESRNEDNFLYQATLPTTSKWNISFIVTSFKIIINTKQEVSEVDT